MELKFNFEYRGESHFGKIYRPYARVLLKSPKQELWLNEWLIVDTGADFTTLPRYIARELDIDLKGDCMNGSTSGVGGKQVIFLLKKYLEVKLGETTRRVPVAFFDNNQVPGLMGRQGFIETFDTEFLKAHVVVFKS